MAREASDSIWASVGAHLSFLTVNRLLFASSFDTGVTASALPDAELLVLGYLALAGVVFAVLGRRRRASSTRHRPRVP